MKASIVFENVSKFYGHVLGVNRVNLKVYPGLTALVGPNGSGKSTLMNLATGLIRPTRGQLKVLDLVPGVDAHHLNQRVGYCTQYDDFPRGLHGLAFLVEYLLLFGFDRVESTRRAQKLLAQVGLAEAARRKVGGYSKGMRQRLRMAQALVHDPELLLLDEPLNGLDPMVRAELIGLFRELAETGKTVVVSSHILHEVDMIADQVVMVNQGYVIAEGEIPEMRAEVRSHPAQVILRCDEAGPLASRLMEEDHVVAIRMHEDREGLLVETRDADTFHLLLNDLVAEGVTDLNTVAPADADTLSLYRYLIAEPGGIT